MAQNFRYKKSGNKLEFSAGPPEYPRENRFQYSKSQPSAEPRPHAHLSFGLVAATPVIFALWTWNDGNMTTGTGLGLRIIGLPVLVTEVTFILLAFMDGWRPLEQARTFSTSARILFCCLICTALASAILGAPSPAEALLWTYVSLVHLMFGFSAGWRIAHAGEVTSRLIWPWVVGGCCTYAAILAVYVARPHPLGFDWEYFGLGVSNVRQVGFYCVVGAMAAIGCAVQSRGAITLFFGAAAAAMFTLSCWTGSRGALLASSISLATAWLFVRCFRNRRAAAVSLASIIVGTGASLLLKAPEPTFGLRRMATSIVNRHQDDPTGGLTSGRLSMWHGAWHAFLQRPVLGYGEGQFGRVVPQIQGIYLHPHDLILQLLFQWGIIGGATAAMLGVLAMRNIRATTLAEGDRALPSLLVLVALFAFSFYDGALFHAYPTMMFTFALASALTFAPANSDSVLVGAKI